MVMRQKLYSYSPLENENFMVSGRFAIALCAERKEDIDRINELAYKFHHDVLMEKDEITAIMSDFDTPNIFLVDSLLRDIGVIYENNGISHCVNSEKIEDIASIEFAGNDTFIKKYMNVYKNRRDLPEDIMDFLFLYDYLASSSPAWTGHAHAMEYNDIYELYSKAMKLVKKFGNIALHTEMYETLFLCKLNMDNVSPNPFLYYNYLFVKSLAKGIQFITDYIVEHYL